MSARGSYTIDSGGAISTGGKFWGNGESRYGVHTVTGGALWHPGSGMVGLWIGAGYGIRSLVWQDTEGAWAEVSDFSVRGLTAETGATLTWKHLSLLAGIRYQSGFSFLAGAGISF